ncbi:MAG: family 20 glycosylhydrolase [Planctomycetes bacterium]|nr:family 20 glycosylhydrolase [Planctomycetota bacterium]
MMERYTAAMTGILILLTAQTLLAQFPVDVATPGFRVTVDEGGWVRVWYRGVPIVTGENFDVSKPGWKGKVFPVWTSRWAPPYRVRIERREDARTIVLTGDWKGAASNTITVEVQPDRVRIENRYRIAASKEVGYVMTDCFLSRDLLDGCPYEDDAGHKGTLRAAGGEGIPNSDLHRAILTTRFGTLTIDMSHEHTVGGKKGSLGWELRNVCDRTWGTEDRRSFSVLNLLTVKEPALIEGRSEYVFTFDPAPALEKELAHRRERQETERQALTAAREKKLAERRARIQAAGGIVVVPQPQRMERLDGEFVVTDQTWIVVGDSATDVDRRAAELLAEELRDYHRTTVPVIGHSQAKEGDGLIVLGRSDINPLAKSLLAEWGQQVTQKDPGPEGYVLEVRPGKVIVAGSDARGTWYGVQALVQLLRWRDDRLTIPCVRIRDWPAFRKRAMMLTLGVQEQKPFLLTTLRRALARVRLNMVFIGGASLGRVQWPSHPEVASDRAFTPEDIRELADFARANFIEPVPHVQGFGHTGNLYKVRPDLLIDKERYSAFDITNPKARQYIFDLYSDAIKAFRPKRYFHVGFDEAKGLDKIAKTHNVAEVVAAHITAVSNWLAKRNLRMVMWADMLLDRDTFGKSSAANSNNPSYGNVETAPALDRIPKSVILANWYYGGAEEHPALKYLAERGFTVFPTTWFSPQNNFNFIRSAHRDQLDWVSGSSWMYCGATNPGMMSLLTGEYAWTPETPTLEELNYEPTELLATWVKPPRPSDVPCEQTPIDIRGAINRCAADDVPGDNTGWLDLGAEHDLSAVPSGRKQMKRYIFDLVPRGKGVGCVLVRGPKSMLRNVPTAVEVPVGRTCDSLVFLHTAHIYQYGPRTLGNYTIEYEDGETVSVPVRNTINTGPWLRAKYKRHFGDERASGYYIETERAWVGYTLAGEEVDLVAFEWTNPRPDAMIAKVKIEATDSRREVALAVFAVTAVRMKPRAETPHGRAAE